MEPLKEKNKRELGKLTLIYVSIIGAGLVETFSAESSFDLNGFAASALLIAAATIAVNLFSDLIPRSVKEVLIFLRLSDRLPSYRAFRDGNLRDPRINNAGVQELFAEKPAEGKDSFSLWFELYKAFGEAPAAATAHKNFLLYREMSVQAYLFLTISFFLGIFIEMNIKFFVLLNFFFILNVIVFSLAARIAANRLVVAVIVEASHKQRPSIKKM